MDTERKAALVEDALDQLAAEIAGDEQYDTPTAIVAISGTDRFIREAPAASKARLFDIIKEA